MIANQHEKGWEVISHRAHRFLDEQLANQVKWRKELKVNKEEAEKTYVFFNGVKHVTVPVCAIAFP